MKTLTSALLVSMSLLSAGAYAASPNIEPNNVPFQGVYGQVDANAPTRAQVVADLAQAKAAGLVTYGEQEYPVEIANHSNKSHDQVVAELAQAKANGQYSFGELDYPVVR
ncbi:DUF4148 domain-containing protein [Bordetella genomosp. 4]|uniref:DUF4148 domain-containing protein n=1 Tax=Bordetella genomosp. 4 TaxID=463044 RepID=A0A261UBW8_9BORD|nr:DUF4148 domain-containing protein [Bordetella genomosp. 4]OZI52631.1 hypothetical protein CAL21_03105 [Bordetella genomosp. 4]OZI59085.1 hypothetical protein CAL20_05480 [Bordetella genomosp. 4]